jgi:citrate lyase alpha subunit
VVDADAAQKAAALVVNSVGQHSLPKRPAIKQTQFDRAVDLVGDAIQAARNAKLGRTRDNKETDTEQAKAAKSLAELLANQPRTANKRSRGNSLYFTSGVD